MCLTIPAKVLEMRGTRATVASRGGNREVEVGCLRVRAGDYVLVQGGLAVAVIDRAEAEEALHAWDEVEATFRA